MKMPDYNFYQDIEGLRSDIIWEVDENWCYTYISGKIKEYIGYTDDELIGKKLISFIDHDEGIKIIDRLQEISFTRERITDIEIRVLNNKKEIRTLLIQGIPLIDSDDKLTGYRGIARDITYKKLLETELKESESHLAVLIEKIPGMTFSSLYDNGFKIKSAGEGAYFLTGYKSTEFLENELLFQSIIHPDDVDLVNNIILNTLNKKKYFEVLYRIITADSKIKWIITKGFRNYKNGVIETIDGFSFDITETMNGVEFGRISSRWFKNLFENAPHGIAIADRNGFIVQVNNTWKDMFGYSDDDIPKLHMKDFRIEQDREPDTMLLKALFDGEYKLYQTERLMLKKDGSKIWCDLTAKLIKDPQEKDVYAIGMYMDITENKRIEEELKIFHEGLEKLVVERTEEINRLTQKVINSQEEERQRIARELHDGVGQTILAAKYVFNSFMKDKKRDIKLYKKVKLLINMASQELREVYSGLYPSMLNELGLADTISWLIRNYLEASDVNAIYNYNIKSELSQNLSLNIYRIMQEMFTNIVKHSRANSVTILLNQTSDVIIIEISDNGKGFEMDLARRSNTGAGLINIRQRVEYLKGHLEMESAPGRTWLKIEIPLEIK